MLSGHINSSMCTDHNLIIIVRKTKVPKAGPKVIVRRSMKYFCEEPFIQDVQKICWRHVFEKVNPDDALDVFN